MIDEKPIGFIADLLKNQNHDYPTEINIYKATLEFSDKCTRTYVHSIRQSFQFNDTYQYDIYQPYNFGDKYIQYESDAVLYTYLKGDLIRFFHSKHVEVKDILNRYRCCLRLGGRDFSFNVIPETSVTEIEHFKDEFMGFGWRAIVYKDNSEAFLKQLHSLPKGQPIAVAENISGRWKNWDPTNGE